MTSLLAEDLVDPLCGVVRRIVPYPRLDGMPDRYVCEVAEVSDTRRHSSWLADQVAAGTSFGDGAVARTGALGEAVERYCGNNIPSGLRRASPDRLAADGEEHLGPADLPGYALWQHRRPGFPYRRFTAGDEVLWVRGEDAAGATCWVPGSWAYLNWHQGSRRREPRHHHLNYAGIACGQGLADAAQRALLEVVERDAAALWWTLGLPATGVRVESVPGLADGWKGSRLRLHLVRLPSELGVPVLAALAYDEELRIAAAGFACRFDPAEAARKAALEAVQVWIASRGLLTQDGAAFEAMHHGILARHAYLPWRADRRYLDDVGDDFSRVRDLAAQAQVWLDDRLHPLLRRFTEPASTQDVDDVAPGSSELLHTRLAEAGRRVVTVDLTTADIAETPLRVARTAVSGLLPNAPAAFPYLGSTRWAEAAARHGRPGFLVTARSVTLAPQPHL